MSIHSGPTQWIVECDHPGCHDLFKRFTGTCTLAIMEAEENGWTVHHDGTAECPKHRESKHA